MTDPREFSLCQAPGYTLSFFLPAHDFTRFLRHTDIGQLTTLTLCHLGFKFVNLSPLECDWDLQWASRWWSTATAIRYFGLYIYYDTRRKHLLLKFLCFSVSLPTPSFSFPFSVSISGFGEASGHETYNHKEINFANNPRALEESSREESDENPVLNNTMMQPTRSQAENPAKPCAQKL